MQSLKQDYEALSQRHQEEVISDQSQVGKHSSFASKEMLEIKDHLIEVERKVSVLFLFDDHLTCILMSFAAICLLPFQQY